MKRILLIVPAALWACNSEVAPTSGADDLDIELPTQPVDVEEDSWKPQNPDRIPGLDQVAAEPRRLSVAQLERSWDIVRGVPLGSSQLPDNLALTLGEPDFRSVNEPSYEPTPLFMKFMVDLAAFFCSDILRADAERPVAERILSRFEDQDENLRHIWARFTGITGEAADADVERLKTVQAGPDDAVEGLWAVCIAAGTSPEFLLY